MRAEDPPLVPYQSAQLTPRERSLLVLTYAAQQAQLAEAMRALSQELIDAMTSGDFEAVRSVTARQEEMAEQLLRSSYLMSAEVDKLAALRR